MKQTYHTNTAVKSQNRHKFLALLIIGKKGGYTGKALSEFATLCVDPVQLKRFYGKRFYLELKKINFEIRHAIMRS